MNDDKTRPIQPIIDGRFVPNKIVERLLDEGPFDMNQIATWDISQQDREQFAQLIGYSLSGFGELNYVSDEVYEAACKCAQRKNELEARNEVLRDKLNATRQGLKQVLPHLFRIHPDDIDYWGV